MIYVEADIDGWIFSSHPVFMEYDMDFKMEMLSSISRKELVWSIELEQWIWTL